MNGVEVREEKACRCSASNLSALNGKDAVVPASKQVSCAHPGSTTASHIESWFTETLCKERSAISAMFESRHQALEQDLRTWLRTRMPSGCSAHAAATSQALWPMSPTKPLEEDEDVYPPLPDAEQEVMQVANAHINAEQVVTKKISVRRSSYIDVPLLDGERDSRASIRASRASSLQMMVKAKTTASRAGISKADKLFTIINGPQHSLMKTSPHMPRSKRLLALLIEQFMGIITMLNIVSISISTDYGTEWTGWVIINAFFAICYTAEMAVKLHLLGCKLYFRGSEYAWNILEATLVFFALTELIITVTALFADDSAEEASSSKVSLLRVVRLARIVRVVRLCKLDAFGELAQIINGAMGGACVPLASHRVTVLLLAATRSALRWKQLLGRQPPWQRAPEDQRLSLRLANFSNVQNEWRNKAVDCASRVRQRRRWAMPVADAPRDAERKRRQAICLHKNV
eukprot:TRINITY_DN22628_c0_g5_i2.p1 TRINITY_DN22628_c0_g5~~TRINITY_DN22628_c0_g5_i2.p1  ORF type:complete len:475 (-),score=49.37 TRINITY_DN22628_c0_g5_i2:292-1674(-)